MSLRTTENEAEPHKAGRLSETVGVIRDGILNPHPPFPRPPPLALTRPDRHNKSYSPMDLTTPIETHLQFWENAGKITQISICFTHKSVDHRHQTRDLFFPITHCVMGLCQWKAPFLGDRPLFSFVTHFSCIFLAKMSSKPRYWSFRTGVIIIKFRLCSP